LQSLPAAFEVLLSYLELVELVSEAVLVEARAPSTMSTQGGLAYSPYASEGLLCGYFLRSDATSAFAFLLRNA
jgi:hypothetical protein